MIELNTLRLTARCGSRNISVVIIAALALSTDLFLASSAFSLEKSQNLHLGSIANHRSIGSSIFSGIGSSDIGDINDDTHSGLGTNSLGTPESLAPLPTSNNFMTPEEVVTTCMSYLQGKPDLAHLHEQAGLEICYNFSSDSCRMANGGSLESFLQYANNPVFQSMVNCARWDVVNVGPEIPATPTRGSMQTVLVHIIPRLADDGAERNDRHFLWTIVRERRPPRQGHCVVHECVAVENAFAHTL